MKKFLKLKYIIPLLLMAFFAFSYFSNKEKRKEASAKFPSKYNPKTHQVVVVKKGDIASTLILSGEIDAEKKADLSFQSSGQLAWVGVKAGDLVKKYQTIASLNKEQLKKQLEISYNNYKSAASSFYDIGDTYKDSVIDTEIKRILERNQNTLNNAVANYELTDLAVKYSSLWSPFSGIVTQVNYPNAGINVLASQVIASIIDPQSLYFSSKIDQDDVNKIKVTDSAIVSLDSYDNEQIASEVTHISFTPLIGESSTVYKIQFKLPVDNQNLKYRLGMDGDATILLSESKDTLIVPIDAIIEQDDKKFVIVKNTDNSLTKKEVITGIENDTDIEIKEGIDQNDEIIIKK